MTNPTHATIILTVALNGADLVQLGDLIALTAEDLGCEVVPCGWAPDLDTIADATPGADYDSMVLVDLNPGVSADDVQGDPNWSPHADDAPCDRCGGPDHPSSC